MKQISKKWAGLFVLMALVTGAAFILSCNPGHSKNMQYETNNKQVESIDGLKTVVQFQSVLRNIAKTISPAVVSINVEGEVVVQNPFMDDPFARRFFGFNEDSPREQRRRSQSMGSGVIVTKDGYLFSNYHVVKDAKKIMVILADQRSFEATLVGVDPELDLAVLKIKGDNLPYAPLGDSDELEVGDFVIAIGSPFTLSGTFTFGVVSAKGRSGMTGYQRFIQSDAAVNPGNSGGPLINIRGQVVGINTAIRSTSGGYEGISFAIPINQVRISAGQIAEKGRVERGYIGINIGLVDDNTRKALGLSNREGVTVARVEKDGPADKAGLKRGDIITRVENDPVGSPEDLQLYIGSKAPGSTVKLEVLRDGKRQNLTVRLTERTAAAAEKPGKQDKPSPRESLEFLGGTFTEAGNVDLERNGAEFGVKLAGIEDKSPLAGVLEEGSIIAAINNVPIRNLEDLKKFAEKNQNRKTFTFLIVKDGFMIYRGFER